MTVRQLMDDPETRISPAEYRRWMMLYEIENQAAAQAAENASRRRN